MFYTIGVLVLATVAACWFLVWPRKQPPVFAFDSEPDLPIAFGEDMIWLAIRARTPDAVASALGVANAEPANWQSGIGAVYDLRFRDQYVFISPPIQGWIFVIGRGLPHSTDETVITDESRVLLADLGRTFSDAQYFASLPDVDLHGWARIQDGKLKRALVASDRGIIWDHGRASTLERKLGLKHFEVRGVSSRNGDVGGRLELHPEALQVMRIAADWSLDPTRIARLKSVTEGVGLAGKVPRRWRTRIVRKTPTAKAA